MPDILLGYEVGTGRPITVGLFHSLITGQTQKSGKTTTVKAMISRAPAGSRILIFDVKKPDPRKPPDYAGLGREVPVYIEERTDPLTLKALLEQSSKMWLKREFPELIRVCRPDDTYRTVLGKIDGQLQGKKKVHPVVEDRLLTLRHLLARLVEEMDKIEVSDRLELGDGVNVMPLTEVHRDVQQLAVASAMRWVLDREANIIVVLDEATRFIPQKYKTPSKEAIARAIREGGAKGIWMWLLDQTITLADKDVLKQVGIWVLGRQREINEARRTLEQIPFKTDLTVKDIQTLKVGQFIVCEEEGAPVTYVRPEWLTEDAAVRVARGEIAVAETEEFKPNEKEVDEMVWKEKCEKLEAEAEALRDKCKQLEGMYGTMERTAGDLAKKNKELEGSLAELKETEHALDALRKALGSLGGRPLAPGQMPAGKLRLGLEASELEVEVRQTAPTEVSISTSTGQGQIMYCAVKDLKDGFTLRDMAGALAERGWPMPENTLKPNLGGLVKRGLLVRAEKGKYRLPARVKVKVGDG